MGLALWAVAAGGFLVKVLGGGDESRPAGARSVTTNEEREATAFYSDVKRSLTPLLNDAPRLSALLGEIAAGAKPAPAVSQVAEQWADSFATARDLVARLHPPVQRWGPAAQTLYQLGASLYVEAGRAVPRIVAAADRAEQRQEALKAVRRLQLLGDRLFDAGNRLLRGESRNEQGVEVRELLPPAVPDFGDEDLVAGRHEMGPRAPVAGTAPDERPIPPSRWLTEHKRAISGAVEKLSHPPDWWLQQDASSDALRTEAQTLEEQSSLLSGNHPATYTGPEGVHDLRLALLTGAESIRTVAWAETGGVRDLEASRRLWLLTERLWSLASDLLVSGGLGRSSLYALPPSGLEPKLLDSGGVFQGHPPPLRPGDDPGKDVPGGLPSPDPTPPAR